MNTESKNLGKLVELLGADRGLDIHNKFIQNHYNKHFEEVTNMYITQEQYYKAREERFDRYVRRLSTSLNYSK
jgi:hypothetical protein